MTYQSEIKRWGKETARRKAYLKRKHQQAMRKAYRSLLDDLLQKRERKYQAQKFPPPSLQVKQMQYEQERKNRKPGLMERIRNLFKRKTGKK